MKHPILVIVLNCIAIVVLCSLLMGAFVLHQNGGLDRLFSGEFSIGFGSDDSFFASDDSYRKGSGSISADGISDIDLSWASGSVRIAVGEGDQITFAETSSQELEEEDEMRWKVENGALKIRFSRRRGWSFISFGVTTPQKTLTLTIPASLAQKLGIVNLTTASAELNVSGLTAKKLTATVASGNAKLQGITADVITLTSASGSLRGEDLVAGEMNLDSASGGKVFENCTVSGTLDCDNASGDFFFSGSVNVLNSDSASGDIELNLTAPARLLEFDSASGDITVTVPSDLPGLSVEMDAASGDLKFDFDVNYHGKYEATYGDGSMKVEVDSASGDVRFKMN